MAPEVFTGEKKYTAAADIYSLSITLWELIMRIIKGNYVRPYEEYKNMKFDWQITAAVVDEGKRPTFPSSFPLSGVVKLIEGGWVQDPSKRLNIEQFEEGILKLEKEFFANQPKWEDLVVKLPPEASPIPSKA